MPYTGEQIKRLTTGLLENCAQQVQGQLPGEAGQGHIFSYMQQPIEFRDTLTPDSPTLYGLVFVLASTKKEEVTALAAAIDRMQIRG